MGMSASQARLIALTARMSDTEYEAQQINQQRLTLSNQMNAVYEAMCNMEVPTPPSKLDPQFYKTVFKGKQGGTDVSAQINDDGSISAFQTVKNGDVVINAGAKAVGSALDPNQFVNTSTAYHAEDFTKYNATDYKEYVTAQDNITEKWADWDEDDTRYVVGTYYEKVKKTDADGTTKEERVEHKVSLPIKETQLPEGSQYDLSGIVTHHCEGSRGVSEFREGKNYKSRIGGEDISGTEAISHNNKVIELSHKQFVKQNSDGTFDLFVGTPVAGMSLFECTDVDKFSTAREAQKRGDTNSLTVGGNSTMSMSAAEQTFGNDTAFINAKNGLQHTFPDNWDSDFTVIVSNDGGKTTFSFCKTDDLSADGSGRGDGLTNVYEYGKGDYEEKIGNLDPSQVTYDATGNITAANIGGGNVSLVAEKIIDEEAYDEAVAKYNNEKAVYDQEQNNLNKQTSIYQRQDKMLEMKLTRLDNERNALNTELEAVKKVIQDSIDRGYKTFSG